MDNIPRQASLSNQSKVLSIKLETLCTRLDDFWKISGGNPPQKFSTMLRGAMYLINEYEQHYNNPDWMSQAAHSLRDIFYHFNKEKHLKNIKWKKHGSISHDQKLDKEIMNFYGFFTSVSHHLWEQAKANPIFSTTKPNELTQEVFSLAVEGYIDVLFKALRRQLDAHTEIDSFLRSDPKTASVSIAQELIGLNFDARQYLFFQASETWFHWLWKNGFLQKMVQKPNPEDIDARYRSPELGYISRIISKVPKQVVDYIVSISSDDMLANPELISQFTLMSDDLSAQQMARIVRKMHAEHWVEILGNSRHWDFVYEKMFSVFTSAQDEVSILLLADTLLAGNSSNYASKEELFLSEDLPRTKIFQNLSKISDKKIKDALTITTKVLSTVLSQGKKVPQESHFKLSDTYHLFDTDLFLVMPSGGESRFHDSNITDLIATIIELTQRAMKNLKIARRIYSKYFQNLPDTHVAWRLKLRIFCMQPSVFKKELEHEFFRLFETARYTELLMGTEYQKALKIGFHILAEVSKRSYVRQVIYMLTKEENDENEIKWKKTYGSRIFSMIETHLTDDEKTLAEEAGFSINSNYEPTPSIGSMRGGTVVAKGPVSLDEFHKLSLKDIVARLKGEWSPAKLRENIENEDFLNPLNAEGTGDLIKNDIALRPETYAGNSTIFFSPRDMDVHYTYSLIQGMIDALKANRKLSKRQYSKGLLDICLLIISEGLENIERTRNHGDGWLADRRAIYRIVTDAVLELLNGKNNNLLGNFKFYRSELLQLITFLLTHPDPTVEEEKLKTAQSKTKQSDSNEYRVSDPHFMAINSVRGRIFEALVHFAHVDGKLLTKKGKSGLSPDVKNIYERSLKQEKTRAVMFMFGHYFATFYYADQEWAKRQLAFIFPKEKSIRHLFTAAWEGYLTSNLYTEMFKDTQIQELYLRGLDLTGSENPEQELSLHPVKGIAEHLALAYIYIEGFYIQHPLFENLWKKDNHKLHAYFVSAIGHRLTSSNNTNIQKALEHDPKLREKLSGLWLWIIENCDEQVALIEFGHWVSTKNGVFENSWLSEIIVKTLEKTKGDFKWDYGLTKSITDLSKANPQKTLEIARLFLFDKIKKQQINGYFYSDEEWIEAIKAIHENPDTTQEALRLVDDLIREGGSGFWNFKKALSKI